MELEIGNTREDFMLVQLAGFVCIIDGRNENIEVWQPSFKANKLKLFTKSVLFHCQKLVFVASAQDSLASSNGRRGGPLSRNRSWRSYMP